MAAGDTSQRLLSDFREELGDEDRKICKTDQRFYRKLAYYEKAIMVKYETSKKDYEIPFTNKNTLSYNLSLDIFKVRSVVFENPLMNTIPKNYEILDITTQPKIKILDNTNVVAGEKIYINAFYKPIIKISKSVDPIIPEDYHKLLVDCVLSEFSTKEKVFKPLEKVELEIKALVHRLEGLDRSNGRTEITRQLRRVF